MYRLFRNTHLFLGLFCCLFLLMYGLSAVQMAHNPWFSLTPKTTETEIPIGEDAARSARSLAHDLMSKHDIRGELTQVRENPRGWRFRISRPGTVYEVDFERDSRQAKVKTHVAGFIGMLNRIHHVRGVDHEYTLLNVWGFFVLLVSIMLIGIGITGIYMWFKLHNERVTGGILLALSLGYSLTLIVLMRTA